MKAWHELTGTERHRTLRTMSSHGGGFAGTLADAWMLADSMNSAALANAFPGLVVAFGPDSYPYKAMHQGESA